MKRILLLIVAVILSACGQSVTASETVTHASPNNLTSELFLRIVKTTSDRSKGYLEAWRRGSDGVFQLDRTFDICTWSGDLGPKLKEGDGQSPEGFYFVKPGAMNPNSSYHLSFNLGFPNAYDRAHNRTGSFLMVHGDCLSIGCYAMTVAGIEEIWALMEKAYDGGQPFVRVHIFPFEMTDEILATQTGNPNHAFWMNLKTGWDWFERERVPPNVTVSNKTYQFSAGD